MKPIKKIIHRKHRGAALILSMIFVLVFSALAVGVAAISGTNVQIADNQRKVNGAFASAESGLEVMRYWLSRVHFPSSTSPTAILSTISTSLQNDLTSNNISNISVNYDGSKINIPFVTLATAENISFAAVLRQLDDDTLQLDVTGVNRQISRTIRVNFDIEPYKFPIFDFGLATKGPLNFNGNPAVRGLNSNREADIYTESQNNNIAVLVTGNTNFDGDIRIGDPNANVDFQGDVLIGGDHDQEAIDNHVFIGVDPPEFPIPDTGRFQQYATGPVIDSSTDTSSHMTLTNTTIQAGTNPFFGGNVVIEGILFIESPNIIVFNRNVQIKGMIVGDGDTNNPGTNKMTFVGNFESGPFPNDAKFDVMRSEAGSSVLTPGFAISLEGNFATLGGVMAVSGASFSGNVGAVVKGTIINYSESPTTVEGNATLSFDRANNVEIPGGFDTTRVLEYVPSSYSEVIL